jgi:tripartite-type tricarboxylate transporter receptor subunit TctC
MIHRRTLLAAPLLAPALAAAQADWPGNRPVRVIHPAVAGSPGDVYTRLLAEHWGRTLGGTFVVENRPGATGSLGTTVAAQAPADGWTLLVNSNTAHVVGPLVLKNLGFDPVGDFTAVAAMYRYGMMLIIAPSIPAKTTAEFVAWARTKPNGTTLASVGIGSVGHLMSERFRQLADFPSVHVPYRGGPPAMLAVAQGEADWIFDNIGNSGALLREGKVRGLSLTGAERAKQMPMIPTLAEDGFPGLLEEVWFGIYAPTGTPRPIIEKLNAATNAWLALPDTVTRMDAGAHIAMPGSPEAMAAFWAEDRQRWRTLIAAVRLPLE